MQAEYLAVGRYIVIPGPAAACIAIDGVHRTAPAPNHRPGVVALFNIICIHQPAALIGIVSNHILLNPGCGRDYTGITAIGSEHIVVVFNSKIHIGIALCPVQGFRALVGKGVGYGHSACIEAQAVPGITIVELIQVKTNVHIGISIEGGPVAIPCTTVGVIGIVIRCSCCIDSKYQVGIACIPQSLQIVSLQTGIGRNGQAIAADIAAGTPVVSTGQLLHNGQNLGFYGNHQYGIYIFNGIGAVFTDDLLTIYLYGNSNAVVGGNSKAIITAAQNRAFTTEGKAFAGGNGNTVINRLHRLNLHQKISKAGCICHHSKVLTGSKGSQIHLEGAGAVCKLIGTDSNFAVAPIVIAVPNQGAAQFTGQSDLQGSVTLGNQILGSSKAKLIVACSTPTDGLCVHIRDSQSAVVAVAVRYPIQQLKASNTGLIHLQAEYLAVGRYIVIPGPAAACIAIDGVHRTAPAPNHRPGVVALFNIICIHQPAALIGIVSNHILLNPGCGRDYTGITAIGSEHIVVVFNSKIHIGIALCPVQGFRALVGKGVGYGHSACIEAQAVPGITIVELIQVKTNVHIGISIEGGPVAIPCTTVGVIGIVIRCSCCIDSKYQVGIACIPQSLQIVSLQAGIGRNGQGICSLSATIAPAICKQQLIHHRSRAIIGCNILLSCNTVQIHCFQQTGKLIAGGTLGQLIVDVGIGTIIIQYEDFLFAVGDGNCVAIIILLRQQSFHLVVDHIGAINIGCTNCCYILAIDGDSIVAHLALHEVVTDIDSIIEYQRCTIVHFLFACGRICIAGTDILSGYGFHLGNIHSLCIMGIPGGIGTVIPQCIAELNLGGIGGIRCLHLLQIALNGPIGLCLHNRIAHKQLHFNALRRSVRLQAGSKYITVASAGVVRDFLCVGVVANGKSKHNIIHIGSIGRNQTVHVQNTIQGHTELFQTGCCCCSFCAGINRNHAKYHHNHKQHCE